MLTLNDARLERVRNDYSDIELRTMRENAILKDYPAIGVLVRDGYRVFYLNGRHYESRNIDTVLREYFNRGCH